MTIKKAMPYGCIDVLRHKFYILIIKFKIASLQKFSNSPFLVNGVNDYESLLEMRGLYVLGGYIFVFNYKPPPSLPTSFHSPTVISPAHNIVCIFGVFSE